LRLTLWLFLPLWVLIGQQAHARRYPITKSDSTGTWIGTRKGLLHGTGELWRRYGAKDGLPSARVNDVELSTRSVWVATEGGLARLDKGSRRWETFKAPTLPSNRVTGVSVDPSDPDLVWVSTEAGMARYNVRENSWARFGTKQGLPAARAHDVLFRGRTVWAATDAGLAAYDVKLKTWTVFTTKNGLAGDRVLEIEEQGSDLWLTCDAGVSRMSLQRRTFLPFRKKEGMPSTNVLSQTRMQNLIYFVTDKGLITYDTSADALAPFLHSKGLLGATVRSVVSAGGFVWFGTDKGLMRFEPTKKVWEYYKVEDGLSDDDVSQVAVAGSFLMVFSSKGDLDTYDYKKDEWVERSALIKVEEKETGAGGGAGPGSQPSASQPTSQPAEKEERGVKLSVSAELDTELKQDFGFPIDGGESTREGYWLINTLRLGLGAQWMPSGRSLDFSGNLDWGDISPLFDGDGSTFKSFQKYDLRLRYLGGPEDRLREIIASSQLRLEPAFEGARLTARTELEGARGVVALGPKREGGASRLATLQVAGGLRRGTPTRVVFRRPAVGSLQIKRFTLPRTKAEKPPRVIPSSVRAVLDGKELERNVDYFVDHENGVVWIKNTDLVHAMRVLEVEYEYEQIPRKDVGAVSMTNMLPKDGDIGQLKRSGQARWARDEQGLFDEIDGGAEQYINRGWTKTLSQDYEWGSAGIILRIHDMGDEKNATSIFLARKLPDAKQVPGLEGWFIEKQTASLSVKGVRGQYYIEISIDQASMEQEILSISGWLDGKLSVKGATAADAMRDAVISTAATLRLTDNTSFGLTWIGARSLDDDELRSAYAARQEVQDLFALHAHHSRRFGSSTRLEARLQAAGSSHQVEGKDRLTGTGLLGNVLLTSPRVTARLGARKYSTQYGGLGVARQTEFCRDKDRGCRVPGTSRMDHEVSAETSVLPWTWLPVTAAWQRQGTDLGLDYADAPTSRERVGVRDIATGQVTLDRQGVPKISLGGGYVRRDDALHEQDQARANAALEADLAEGLLKRLKFKKIYLRGLYELGRGQVDEFRTNPADERDRTETMHHGVGELRLAPTLTESGYATLEYHGLRGALDADDTVVDLLTYWRLDAGGGSSIVPGIAARFDATLWFGDDQPLVNPDPASGSLDEERTQEADSRLSGVLDLFPGEYVRALSPLKFNVAYTYTLQGTSRAARTATTYPLGKELCQNGLDDDGDGQTDCQDRDCYLDDACLVISGEQESHRVYGTAYWDTPGKLQVELFGDGRLSYSGRDRVLRSTRIETRSYVTWRPIYSSPLTLRFDMSRERKRPEAFDGIVPLVEPVTTTYEPALEWRRRWSAKWWHLAKLSVQYSTVRDQTHILTTDTVRGKAGELERLDFDGYTIKPSVEIRRRFEDPNGNWNVRPYVRASYALGLDRLARFRIDDRICNAGDPCLDDRWERSGTLSASVGVIWIHGENVSVDLDLNTTYNDCSSTDASCVEGINFTPHLLATIRY
jgi:hypothetical protein